jgi:hypothetical protein
MDIGLNRFFDLELDDRNDLPLVRGRAEFEQRLAFSVTNFFQDVVGSVDRPAALTMLQVHASRVAHRYGEIERIAQLQVEYDEEEPNTINMTLIYDTGDDFTFSISE